MKPRSPIKARSAKRARLMRTERVPLVKEMLYSNPFCELGTRIVVRVPTFIGCGTYAVGLHEKRKRSQGGSLLNKKNLLRCCSFCNGWVEDNPRLAHELGLVVKRGDPGWAELGADRD